MIIEGMIGRFIRGMNNDITRVRLTHNGSIAVAQIEASKAERARAGVRFAAVNGTSSTFLAPVVAWPTTAFTMALWNGEPDGGKSYFIDTAFAFLASGTPGAGGALLGAVTMDRQALNPTAYANTVLSGLSGKLAGATKARFANAITIVGGTPAWVVLAGGDAAGTGATIATHVEVAEVNGGIVVPPGYMFGLTMLSGAGTLPLYGFGVTWDEISVELE